MLGEYFGLLTQLAYIADIISILKLKFTFQVKNIIILNVKIKYIEALCSKLEIWQNRLGKKDFERFTMLNEFLIMNSKTISERNIQNV